jgi:hypothetical protein
LAEAERVDALVIVLIVIFGIRGAMKPWETKDHIIEDDPPEVRRAGNVLGWLIAIVVGGVIAVAFLSMMPK